MRCLTSSRHVQVLHQAVRHSVVAEPHHIPPRHGPVGAEEAHLIDKGGVSRTHVRHHHLGRPCRRFDLQLCMVAAHRAARNLNIIGLGSAHCDTPRKNLKVIPRVCDVAQIANDRHGGSFQNSPTDFEQSAGKAIRADDYFAQDGWRHTKRSPGAPAVVGIARSVHHMQ